MTSLDDISHREHEFKRPQGPQMTAKDLKKSNSLNL